MHGTEAAKAVKEYLINLAIEDKLPSDLNELNTDAIAEAIVKGIGNELILSKAMDLLCDNDELEGGIMAQVELIAEQAKKDGNELIDNVEGVIVWEKVVNSFTCDEFLEQIGY